MVIINKIHITTSCFLLLGIILNLIPLPEIVIAFRPPILLLILIYWSLAYPRQINLTYAFVTGLIMDILLVYPLGFNALTHVISIYLILQYYPQIRLHSNWNKMFSLLILLIPYFLMCTLVNKLLGIDYNIYNVCISIITSIIIWPSLFNMLRFIRQKYTS